MPGRFLQPHQEAPVAHLLQRLSALGYDRTAVQAQLGELVNVLAPACPDHDSCWSLAEELDEWVRWKRGPGLCAAYAFHELTKRMRAPAHVLSALILADAQVAVADDLALYSIEVAWLAMEGVAAAAPEAEVARTGRADIMVRLQRMHEYYAHWSRPFDYIDANPLTDTLYTRRLWASLETHYPEQADDITVTLPPSQRAGALLRLANAAKSADDTYHWLVARRLAAIAFQAAGDLLTAESETSACLRDARQVGLESEIGHLLRQHASQLMRLGELPDAESALEAALAHEQPITLFGYWYALTARELGDVRARMAAAADEQEFDAIADRALDAYYGGRQLLDAMAETGGPAVGAVVKRQMQRSYIDNAISVAAARGNADDVLAEIEASGPRSLSYALAETRALTDLNDIETAEFLAARSVFHHHLTSVPRSFDDYVASLRTDLDLRRHYETTRRHMQLQPGRRACDEVVQRLSAHVGDDRLVLIFFISRHRTSRAWVFDLATGGLMDCVLGEIEQPLRAGYDTYVAALRSAAEVPEYPPRQARRALDTFLTTAEALLEPALQTLSGWVDGRRLVVIPQLHLNAVPIAALHVGAQRLVDVASSVSVVPSLGLLADMLDDDTTSGPAAGLTALHETRGTPFFAGTLRHVVARRQLTLLEDPTQVEAKSALSGTGSGDLLLACHGEFDNDNPALSTLRISAEENMTLANVWAGVTHARLRSIILGACESGLARTEIGSEYIGLTGALLSAGVRSVVASLWKVNQLSTAILVSECLSQDGDVPTALAASQRSLRSMDRGQVAEWISSNLPELAPRLGAMIDAMPEHPFAHPDDWAGFYAAGL